MSLVSTNNFLTIASTCLAYCHGYVLRRFAPGTNRANYGSQVKRMFHGRFAHGYTRKDARAILGAGRCFLRPVKKSNTWLMHRFTIHGFEYCLDLCSERYVL
jgi:hypothetical protein